MSKYLLFPSWRILLISIWYAIVSAAVGSLFFSVFAIWVVINWNGLSIIHIVVGGIFCLMYSISPAILGGAILSGLIYAASKAADPSIRKKSMMTGMIIGALGSLVASLLYIYVFPFFALTDTLFLGYSLLAVIIAMFCGRWTRLKIFNEIGKQLEGVKNE